LTEASTTKASPPPVPKDGGGSRRRRMPDLGPLPWIGPALLLIFGVVLWPTFEMLRTSFQDVSISGISLGLAGFDNFQKLFANPDLPSILIRTLTWVLLAVGLTILISLALAALLNAAFPGRRLVRWALIVPWAASVVMTATIFRWMLDAFYGIINRILFDLGLISVPINEWLGIPGVAFWWLLFVAIFVSLPFTTYVILAGLQSIPRDIYEAAKVDGATGWNSYRSITLPLLRPALLVASIINMINVYNSFPIIWAMTGGGPGSQTDTTTTFMYKLAFRFQDIGQSAAMAVVNFSIILVFILLYLRLVDWRRA
jgi:multiple sugar transport system permease protein